MLQSWIFHCVSGWPKAVFNGNIMHCFCFNGVTGMLNLDETGREGHFPGQTDLPRE
jgi:hypothetical protein